MKRILYFVLRVSSLICSGAICLNAFSATTLPIGNTELQNIPVPKTPNKDNIKLPDIQFEKSDDNKNTKDQTKILVNQLVFKGNTVYDSKKLLSVFSPDFIGVKHTLGELKEAASKITNFYRSNGYFLAKAYLPQQDIVDGKVTIAIIEGRYGKKTIQNSSEVREIFFRLSQPVIKEGDLISIGDLERELLLLNDLPGVDAKGSLAPGQDFGTSDFNIEVNKVDKINGAFTLDNAGNLYTGSNRATTSVNINEPLGIGDIVNFNNTTSEHGLLFNKLAYEVQNSGYKVGVAKTYLNYQLGNAFASLGASGSIDIKSAYVSYSVIRSRRSNLTVQVSFDEKNALDTVASTSTASSKNIKSQSLTISGDHKDNFWIEGQSNFVVTLLSGQLNLLSPDVVATDVASAQTNGSYSKVSLNLSRTEALSTLSSVRFGFTAQWASKNLDATEKFILGGMNGVRSYPASEAAGDQGYITNIETQTLIPQWSESLPGYLQVGVFIDNGHVQIARNPWTVTNNIRNLSSFGLSSHWYYPEEKLDFKISVAQRLGSELAQSAPDTFRKTWLTLTKFF
jgi:hemolysin activation/secretion protein